MNSLLTGGTGFVGSALARKLLEDGHNVCILTRDARKIDNSLSKSVDVLQGDIVDSISLQRLNSKLEGKDVIFHLAASLDYWGDRRKLFQANVEGTLNLLKVANRNRIRKFVYVSSVEAMGLTERSKIPADETFACRPVSPYGASKLEAERIVRKFAEGTDLAAPVLRLGNVYGEGSRSFILEMARAILKKDILFRCLPVYKNRYLHPVYVKDVINGIVAAAAVSNVEGTYILAGEEPVTVGRLFRLIAEDLNVEIDLEAKRNPKEILNLELRKIIHKLSKRANLLTYVTAGGGERVHRAYSIEKAKRCLHYAPNVNLREGIARTLGWARAKGLIGTEI